MRVSLVIPNWNGAEKLRRNLPKVLKVKEVSEVIVSDDGSTDGSVELLEREFPQVKLIKRPIQGGFSTNVNTGVSQIAGDLILLVNSDAVPDEDCLKYVLPHFEEPRVFSVGLNTGGGSWSWARWRSGFFWHYASGEKIKGAHETLWSSGGGAVFRKRIWDELGGLDELLNPFYEEDVDIGYRAVKRGYINIFEPRARVEHYREEGVISLNYSKAEVARTAQRNQLIFIWKNIHDGRLMGEHLKALTKRLVFHPKYWRVFLPALTRLPQVLKKREMEKKLARLSDREILGRY